MVTNVSVSEDNADIGNSPFFDFVELDVARKILQDGQIELLARMPYSSNATFLVRVIDDELAVNGIYKPIEGERPLWDFPRGLHRREIAAYELSEALGWGVVPPTLERVGPHGTGSVQLFIDADFSQHHFTLVKDVQHHPTLRKLCVLDLLANNTDRKAGHCLLSKWGAIYGIDHGLCFSSDFKLRTVIWEFANQPIDEELLVGINRLAEGSVSKISSWLDQDEIDSLVERARWLQESPVFPEDDGYRWPWPLI
jgi:uncharacterized repeat protein (TIGR03843 family)